MRLAISIALAMVCAAAPSIAQQNPAGAARRKTFDEFLDLYVRDGYVYYRALRSERSRFDMYVNSLGDVEVGSLPRDDQLAFWLNAYNALVLRTVIDHYPIQGRSPDYPAHSIRQIPGAFERIPHRVAGRTLTLDQIEQTVLPRFHDPRVYLALGRGSVDGGRLRSEALAPGQLETQLKEVSDECLTRSECVHLDREANTLTVSAIFSWREKDFVAAYADKAPDNFATRSPIERAVLAFIQPKLLTTERDFLAQNQFQLAYRPYDWSLNDLTG